jgi:hypothetical protein
MRLSVSPATLFSDASVPNHTKMFELVHMVTSMNDFALYYPSYLTTLSFLSFTIHVEVLLVIPHNTIPHYAFAHPALYSPSFLNSSHDPSLYSPSILTIIPIFPRYTTSSLPKFSPSLPPPLNLLLNLLPVTTTLVNKVVNIFANFHKNLKGPNGILRGPGETIS